MVLTEFKFGDLNTVCHTHVCINNNYYWLVLNLVIC